MLKITYSTAFTVSILSWAFSQFKEGYRASGNLDFGANTVRCALPEAASDCLQLRPLSQVMLRQWRALDFMRKTLQVCVV